MSDITKNTNRESIRSFSSRSYCFNFFSFCKHSEPEYLDPSDPKDNKKTSTHEDQHVLMTQHYSTQVKPSSIVVNKPNGNGLVNEASSPSLPLKFQFKMNNELRLYNNMQLLLTFNTNIFLLRSPKCGLISKINVKLLKIDRSLSEKFSFNKLHPPFLPKNHRNSNRNTSVKNSLSELENSQPTLQRNQKILQEIIKNFAKKIAKDLPLIVDISKNEGVTAVAWAYEGVNVLVIEEDLSKLNKLKANVILSGEKAKIDIIYGRFEELGSELRANLVFYQPENTNFIEIDGELVYSEVFSLIKNLPKKIIGKCLNVAENLAILLPKTCNLNELAEIFVECFEENNMYFVYFIFP